MKAMNQSVWTLRVEKVGFLSRNPRLAKMFPNTRLRRLAGHVSREARWGSDGASLEYVSDFSVDPILYNAGDPNLYRYVRDNPVIYVDPSGLFTVDGPHGHKASGGPTDALGGMFTFSRQPGDGPYVIQDVVVTGTLLCDTSDGYNVVGFRYSWTEVWAFGYYGRVRDTHLNSAGSAIAVLSKHCHCACDFKKHWSFTSTAEFVVYAGMVSPATSYAVTPVDASTTYRCAEATDEGTTLEGKDAIMDMYPGKRSDDPTAPTGLSRGTITRAGTPGYDTDTWVCNDGTCQYTSTGYHPRGPQ